MPSFAPAQLVRPATRRDGDPEISVRLHSGERALLALADADWHRLLEESGRRDPTRRLAVLSMPDAIGPDGTPRVIVVRRGGHAVAAAPLLMRHERGLVVVRHLGSLAQGFDFEPPAADHMARRALALALMSQPGDLLTLDELDPGGPLAEELRRCGVRLEARPTDPGYHVELDRPVAALGKRRRQAAALLRRAERSGIRLTAQTLTDRRHLSPALDGALDLLWRSWRDRPGDAYTGSAEGRAAIRETVMRMAEEDRVRLTRVEADGRLVAFHIAFVWGPAAVLYKTAFDRERPELPGLGWLSLLTALDALAAEGVARAALGPGGDAYKQHAARSTPLATLRAPLSLRGRAYLRLARSRRALQPIGPDGPPARLG